MPRFVMPMVLQPLDDFGGRVFENFLESLKWLEDPSLNPENVIKYLPVLCDGEPAHVHAAVEKLTATTHVLRTPDQLKLPPGYRVAGEPAIIEGGVKQVVLSICCDYAQKDSRERLFRFLDDLASSTNAALTGGREQSALIIYLLLKAFRVGKDELPKTMNELALKIDAMDLRCRVVILTDRGSQGPVAAKDSDMVVASTLFFETLFLSANWSEDLGSNILINQQPSPFSTVGIRCLDVPVRQATEYLSLVGAVDLLTQAFNTQKHARPADFMFSWPSLDETALAPGIDQKPFFDFKVGSPFQTPKGLRDRFAQAKAEFLVDYTAYISRLRDALEERRQRLSTQVTEVIERNLGLILAEEQRILSDPRETAFLSRIGELYSQPANNFPDASTSRSEWAHINQEPADRLLAGSYRKFEAMIDNYPNGLAMVLYLGALLLLMPRLLTWPLSHLPFISPDRVEFWIWTITIGLMLAVLWYWVPAFIGLWRETGEKGFLQKDHRRIVQEREDEFAQNVRALVPHWVAKAQRWFSWRLKEREQKVKERLKEFAKRAQTMGDDLPQKRKELIVNPAEQPFTALVDASKHLEAFVNAIRKDATTLRATVPELTGTDCVTAWEKGEEAYCEFIRQSLVDYYRPLFSQHDFIKDIDPASLAELMNKQFTSFDWMMQISENHKEKTRYLVSVNEDQKEIVDSVDFNLFPYEKRDLYCFNRVYLWRAAYNLASDRVR